MDTSTQPAVFLKQLNEALSSGSFLKVTLSNYSGPDADLKNIYLRLVEINQKHATSGNTSKRVPNPTQETLDFIHCYTLP